MADRTRIIGPPSQIKTWQARDPDGKPSAVVEFIIPGYDIEIHLALEDLQRLHAALGQLAGNLRAKVN